MQNLSTTFEDRVISIGTTPLTITTKSEIPIMYRNKKFNYFWDKEGEFVEKLNKRGKGWSGVIVSKQKNTEDNTDERICIKKQENYVSYSFFHFIRGTLTIENEIKNLNYCSKHGINTPEIVYSDKRKLKGKRQAILVTRFLEGYMPLSDIMSKDLFSKTQARKIVISKIANEVSKLHKMRMMHNNLYPKHIFIDPQKLEICFIDLEKSRKKLSSKSCTLRDLDVLNRYTRSATNSDKLRFLKAYYNEKNVTDKIRKIWKKLAHLAEIDLKKQQGKSNVQRNHI